MWLFTPEGFFSIVSADEFDEELMIRARDADDLDRLRSSYLPSLGPNLELAGRDYPARAFTTREEFARCLASMARDLDYENFKNEVAVRHSAERAHIYHDVWSACLKIASVARRRDRERPKRSEGPADIGRWAEYRSRDLHAEGEWPPSSKPRYGSVIFDDQNRVLLREPAGHFDGYHWTFAKGASENDEHPVDTALRETLEETGHTPIILCHLPGSFSGGRVGATAYFYLMRDRGVVDVNAMHANRETNAIQWASYSEARQLIGQSTNLDGRTRDLSILDAAFEHLEGLVSSAG